MHLKKMEVFGREKTATQDLQLQTIVSFLKEIGIDYYFTE